MTIGLFIYAIIALALLRPLTGHFAFYLARNSGSYKLKPTGDYWTGGFVLALGTSIFWPVLLTFRVVGKLVAIGDEAEAKMTLAKQADKERVIEHSGVLDKSESKELTVTSVEDDDGLPLHGYF